MAVCKKTLALAVRCARLIPIYGMSQNVGSVALMAGILSGLGISDTVEEPLL